MIVRNLQALENTDRDVRGPTFASRRLLLAEDGLSYSLHDTVLAAGTVTPMWYANHVESVYCISGEAILTNQDNGEQHRITPGTLYVLDRHEHHQLEVIEDLRVVCVFTPALTGGELHDENGTYPLLTARAADPAAGHHPAKEADEAHA